MKKIFTVMASVIAGGAILTSASAAQYSIDQVHSTLGFSVAHLVITKTTGQFDDYKGTINFDKDDLSAFSADVTIQTESINTNNEKRDDHLRNSDFFDAPAFPTIVFKGTSIEHVEGDNYVIKGDFTMKDVTKEIEIPVEIKGPVANPFGGTLIGLEGETVIDRREWNMEWNKAIETGGVVVGNEVTLKLNIQAHGE